ncbi:hypothetical protein ZOSMA_20G00150 [Zostera marina]|uniref:Uncharacterized protein n=1 Tax=Zostera marina TaxID=29655 RepID=A0A0K9PKF1_ZOSMR|nr:hypothetical protein ZOSMA_20G00150 [Zostera marina]
MATEESEAVFNSYNLNPQLFINEVFNAYDDFDDEAFDYFLQEGPSILGWSEETEKSEELVKAVSAIRDIIQEAVDKQLSAWEIYCLHHCFSVPEGFSLSQTDVTLGNGLLVENFMNDGDLDNQIQSLRDKLILVERESAELQNEIEALEKQDVLYSKFEANLAEVQQQYRDNSSHELSSGVKSAVLILQQKLVEMIDESSVNAGNILDPNHESIPGGNPTFNCNISTVLRNFLE